MMDLGWLGQIAFTWEFLAAVMSIVLIDLVLAVGAASHGNLFLLLFGLALSVPFVVFMSNLLLRRSRSA